MKYKSYTQSLQLVCLVVCFTSSLTVVSKVYSMSEQERGAHILDKKLQQAQHLKELEYQAEVLERQARIAKAQLQIDKTIGLDTLQNIRNIPEIHGTHQKNALSLPKIIELTSTTVTFEFLSGDQAVFTLGETLPSGYFIESISMIEGVILKKDASIYQVNYSW